jgi:hypothetical protein
MIDKDEITIGDRFRHPKGLCTFTEIAFALEAMNPDPTSLFVLFDNEHDEVEVSLSLLSIFDDLPKVCNLCLREFNGLSKLNICSDCVKRLADLGDKNGKRTEHNDSNKII